MLSLKPIIFLIFISSVSSKYIFLCVYQFGSRNNSIFFPSKTG